MHTWSSLRRSHSATRYLRSSAPRSVLVMISGTSTPALRAKSNCPCHVRYCDRQQHNDLSRHVSYIQFATPLYSSPRWESLPTNTASPITENSSPLNQILHHISRHPQARSIASLSPVWRSKGREGKPAQCQRKSFTRPTDRNRKDFRVLRRIMKRKAMLVKSKPICDRLVRRVARRQYGPS
jgi:hypothetical protein